MIRGLVWLFLDYTLKVEIIKFADGVPMRHWRQSRDELGIFKA